MQGGVRLSDALGGLDRGKRSENGRPKQPLILTFEGAIREIAIRSIPGPQFEIGFAVLEPGCARWSCNFFLRVVTYNGPNSQPDKYSREREILEFFTAGKATGLCGVVNAAVENGRYFTRRIVRSFELEQFAPPFKHVEAELKNRLVVADSYRSSLNCNAEQAGIIC